MEKIMRDLSKNFNEIKKFSLKSQKKFFQDKIFFEILMKIFLKH